VTVDYQSLVKTGTSSIREPWKKIASRAWDIMHLHAEEFHRKAGRKILDAVERPINLAK